MKIMIGVPEYPPHHIGGGGAVFEALAQEYLQLGHEVMVIYGYYPTAHIFKTIQQYTKDGISFVQVPLLPTPSFLPFLKTVLPTAPRNLSKLCTIIKDFNPDVAHIHGYGLLFINQLAKIVRSNNIPYIYTLHGAPVSADKKGGLLRIIYNRYKNTRGKAILDHATHLTAVSQYTVNHFSEFQYYKDKITVIHNGIYTHDFVRHADYNVYENYDIPQGATIYCSIGRIEWIKGFDLFIKMIPRLIQSGIDVRYVIAGKDNGHKATLEKLAHDLGVSDRIYYLGFIGGNDKLSALQYADYVIVPSLVENWPAVPLEALSMGKVVVVNRAGGMTEQIQDGFNGIIVDFSNVDEYIRLLDIDIPKDTLLDSVQKYERSAIAQQYLSMI